MSAFSTIEDRVMVVTGGGQGIGRGYSIAYANGGGKIVVADKNIEGAERVASEIKQQGGTGIAVEVDIANAASVERMIETTVATFGKVDALINNASIFSTITMRPFEEIPLDEWDLVLRVNITGAFLAARAALPHMKAAGWGRIVNIASAAVTMGRPNYLHYVTSKAAIIGMSRSMAREVGKYGITVNSVLPGATDTEVPRATVTEEQKRMMLAMRCIPRAGEPEDLVGIVRFLCSEESAFITGQSFTVDGGLTHL